MIISLRIYYLFYNRAFPDPFPVKSSRTLFINIIKFWERAAIGHHGRWRNAVATRRRPARSAIPIIRGIAGQ